MPSGKRQRQRLKAQSRQWSCSELVGGHNGLMSTKAEKESDDELDKKIQDGFSLCLFMLFLFNDWATYV